jgi:hypothetical protein
VVAFVLLLLSIPGWTRPCIYSINCRVRVLKRAKCTMSPGYSCAHQR